MCQRRSTIIGCADVLRERCVHDHLGREQLRRAEAIRCLPRAYSLALRLGLADELIAECLAVEREALSPLLDVAEAKLAGILGSPGWTAKMGDRQGPPPRFPPMA